MKIALDKSEERRRIAVDIGNRYCALLLLILLPFPSFSTFSFLQGAREKNLSNFGRNPMERISGNERVVWEGGLVVITTNDLHRRASGGAQAAKINRQIANR